MLFFSHFQGSVGVISKLYTVIMTKTNNNESNFKSKFVGHIYVSEPTTHDPLIIICITVTRFFNFLIFFHEHN